MVKFENVSFAYDKNVIFSGLNLTLPERGVAAVMGESGRGKTTLLRLLSGLIQPKAGTISGLQHKKAVVFQEDRLLPWLNALENVSVVNESGDAQKWLALMELNESADLMPAELSGGMARRVAIARAMNYGGDILILDEPFKGLDPKLRGRIAQRIGGVFPLTIISTHDIAEAELLGEVTRIDL